MDWPSFVFDVTMCGMTVLIWIGVWRHGRRVKRKKWEDEVRREFRAIRQETDSLHRAVTGL